MFMHLDVNTDVYPMFVNDKFTMALAHTLNLDGTPDTGYYTQVILLSLNFSVVLFYCITHFLVNEFINVLCQGGRKTLADKYEYVMHGKLYQIQEEGSRRATRTYVSMFRICISANMFIILCLYNFSWYSIYDGNLYSFTCLLRATDINYLVICFWPQGDGYYIWWASDVVEGRSFICLSIRAWSEAILSDQEAVKLSNMSLCFLNITIQCSSKCWWFSFLVPYLF